MGLVRDHRFHHEAFSPVGLEGCEGEIATQLEDTRMTRARLARCAAFLTVPVILFGCNEPKADMEAGGPPPRPAELDRLDMFVGSWEGTAEIMMPGADEAMTSTGKNEATWELDKRFLVSKLNLDMGEHGTMEGLEVWTWDNKAKTYRTWWFSSMGDAAQATARYDEESGELIRKEHDGLRGGEARVGVRKRAVRRADPEPVRRRERLGVRVQARGELAELPRETRRAALAEIPARDPAGDHDVPGTGHALSADGGHIRAVARRYELTGEQGEGIE